MKIDIVTYSWYSLKEYHGLQKDIADFYGVKKSAVSHWINRLEKGEASTAIKAKLFAYFAYLNGFR